MINLVYFGLTLCLAVLDSFFKQAPFYTVVNVILRICVILPLVLVVVKGDSRYARVLRKTLWFVLVADSLLPVVFPAGMAVFLVVHVLNTYNFYQHIELSRQRLLSVVAPAVLTFAVALALYVFFLFPSLDAMFRILVGVYLVPITAAWSLSITSAAQDGALWRRVTSVGMFLFFLTDFQVAAELLAGAEIPFYGFVNAFTYYIGLFLMSRPTAHITDGGRPALA